MFKPERIHIFILSIPFIILVALLAKTPVSDPISSVEEARQIFSRLGVTLLPGDIPVVVFI
ncbi:MAG: hypothetical protein ACD_39C01727G0006, partial [uncultured bacterium]